MYYSVFCFKNISLHFYRFIFKSLSHRFEISLFLLVISRYIVFTCLILINIFKKVLESVFMLIFFFTDNSPVLIAVPSWLEGPVLLPCSYKSTYPQVQGGLQLNHRLAQKLAWVSSLRDSWSPDSSRSWLISFPELLL